MSVERLTADDQLVLWPDELLPEDMGAMSDAGQFNIMAVADGVAYPDPGVFTASELPALAASVGVRPDKAAFGVGLTAVS